MPQTQENVVVIDISTKKYPNSICLIDAQDAAIVLDGGPRWFAISSKACPHLAYASRNIKKNGKYETQRMHTLLTGVLAPFIVDHRNGNGLDNRRSNLRISTYAENNANRKRDRRNKSGFKGVTFQNGAWCARVRKDSGKTSMFMGGFETARDAAYAYDAAARTMFGEFAMTNLKLKLLD